MIVKKTQQDLGVTLEKNEQTLGGLESALDNNVRESSEANNGLPEGWANCKLMELGEIVTGNTPSKKNPEYYGGKFPIFKPGDLGSSKGISEASEYLSESGKQVSRFIPAFSTYVTCIGATISKIGYSAVDGTCNQQINAITSNCYVDTRWLYFLMVSPSIKNKIITSASNTTLPILNKSRFSDLQAVLPPLAEQTVIAQTLDTLLAQVDNIKTRLDAIPKILKTFRQSVLAAAVSGKLTEEWRGENECGEWRQIKLSEIVEKIEAGKSLKCIERPPVGDELGIIKISAVTWGIYDEEESKTLPSPDLFIENRRVQIGDFLISRANTIELLGNPVIVHAVSKNLMLSDKVLRLVMAEENKQWVSMFLRSSKGRKAIENGSTGNQNSMRNIGQKALLNIDIPKPNAEEQSQIVHRVEELFRFSDQIEQQVKNAQGRVNNLTQSILAKAFCGALTTQWRADNPDLISGENSAQALLAKIQEEREKQKLKPKKKSSAKIVVQKEPIKKKINSSEESQSGPIEQLLKKHTILDAQQIFENLSSGMTLLEVFSSIANLTENKSIIELESGGIKTYSLNI
jgi:type I restriction enzyme S subunit